MGFILSFETVYILISVSTKTFDNLIVFPVGKEFF